MPLRTRLGLCLCWLRMPVVAGRKQHSQLDSTSRACAYRHTPNVLPCNNSLNLLLPLTALPFAVLHTP